MAETAEAVARLGLDATGFDRQAKQSLESFTKQLRGVQDATDVVISGAEQLQKRFVKSLGGVAVIGLANALGDAMRDVGSKISGTAQAAADASSGFKGLAGSFEEGTARAEKLNAAAAGVAKTLEELNNSTSLKGLAFKAFGGEGVLANLQDSLKGSSAAEQYAGAVNALKRARETAGMSPEQVKAYDLQAQREQQLAQARALGGDFGSKTEKALQEKFSLEDIEAQRQKDAAQKLIDDQAAERAKKEQDAKNAAAAKEAAKQKEVNDAIEAARKKGSEAMAQRAGAAVRLRQQMREQYEAQKSQLFNNYLNQSRAAQAYSASEGLASSRYGAQMLANAQRRQANANRLDNYKFNQEQIQSYADRMAKRGSGQSLSDFEKYSNMAPDARRQKAAQDLADQKARRDNPSDRDKASATQEKIRELLEKNLEELRKYAHVT